MGRIPPTPPARMFDTAVTDGQPLFWAERKPPSFWRCLFLDLLIKEAVLSKKQGIFWVTPEELEIFNEPDNRSDVLKRLKV